MCAVFVYRHKIRLIISKVHSIVGVFDGEAERARQFCECLHVLCIVQEFSKLALEVVIAWHRMLALDV